MTSNEAKRDIWGNLAATPLASMLHTVRDRSLTGRGTFTRGEDKVELAFRDGQIVHAASNDPDQRLGEVLLRQGVLSLKQYNESVQQMLETGRRQGEILVAREYLTEGELHAVVRQQMKELVYWLMRWEEGRYIYRWTPPIEESILLDTNLYELILRGMRRVDQFSKLREALAPWSRVVELNTEIDLTEARDIRLREDESTVLGWINGARSVSAIVDEVPLKDMVVLQILHGLKWARIINVAEVEDPFEESFA